MLCLLKVLFLKYVLYILRRFHYRKEKLSWLRSNWYVMFYRPKCTCFQECHMLCLNNTHVNFHLGHACHCNMIWISNFPYSVFGLIVGCVGCNKCIFFICIIFFTLAVREIAFQCCYNPHLKHKLLSLVIAHNFDFRDGIFDSNLEFLSNIVKRTITESIVKFIRQYFRNQ